MTEYDVPIPVDLFQSRADNLDGQKLEELIAEIEGEVEYHIPIT